MKLVEKSLAKDFHYKDVYGNPISLEMYRGRKLLLAFMRYTGCPICNLHIHQLLLRKDEIEASNLSIVLVYESSTKTILKYIKNENIPFTFISDPEQVIYKSYSVEKSWVKLIKLFLSFKGLADCMRGFSKFHRFSSMRGSINRVSAEFLIDEKGILEKVYYGKIVGDHMPMAYYLEAKH